MSIKQYNENSGAYEPPTPRSGAAQLAVEQPISKTIGEHNMPNVDYYVPRGEKLGQKYYDRFQGMIDRLPSIYGGGGGAGNPNQVEQQSIEDVGYSDRYKDFSGAVVDNMEASLDPNANPFGVEEMNIQSGDINRQFQQAKQNLANQAASEGWANTPKYEKAVRQMDFENTLATGQNRVQYKQAASGWDLNNRQIVTQFYSAFTASENKNREIKLQTGKINADYAWAASKERARIAASNAAAARSNRLASFNKELGLIGTQYDIETAERDYNDGANWDRFAAATNTRAFEIGVEKSDAEMEWEKNKMGIGGNPLTWGEDEFAALNDRISNTGNGG